MHGHVFIMMGSFGDINRKNILCPHWSLRSKIIECSVYLYKITNLHFNSWKFMFYHLERKIKEKNCV